MRQVAPYPVTLVKLVDQLRYKDGWEFDLADIDRGQGSEGLTLRIYIDPPDAYHPGRRRRVVHYFIVPAAAYDMRSWRRWLLDRILDIEAHEACEFFQIGADHPYGPSHGPGNDPYLIREIGTDLDRATAFTGKVNQ